MAADVLRNLQLPESLDFAQPPNLTFEPGVPRPPSQASIESVDSTVLHTGLQEELKDVWPLKCVYPVLEILSTEESYVYALEQMLKGYRDPLCNWLQASQDGETFIRTVFSNLGQLFNTHRRFLQSLKNTACDPREFGQVFVRTESDFAEYTEYCTNFNTAIQLLQQTTEANAVLKDFLLICQRELGHNLSLDAYLIKPVQRILKYHLLLREVLKHFNPEHHGHPSLKNALNVMTQTARHINNVKRQMENSIRVKEIQQSLYGGPTRKLTSYGELLHESKCKVHVGKKGAQRERELLMFDKLLLLLKRKDSKRYNYKGHIEVGELGLGDVVSEPSGFQMFSRAHRSHTYHVTVRSKKVKEEWVRRIKTIIHSNNEENAKLRREMGNQLRRKRLSLDPQMMVASDRTRRLKGMERGSERRKRKALSDIFPNTQNEDGVPQLKKLSRINPETQVQGEALRADGWSEEGREEWMIDNQDQHAPEDSGVVLQPISEDDSSIFSSSGQSSDYLQPTRYLDTSSKMSGSVSMESLVSLNDVEFEDEESEAPGHTHFGGRYLEEVDTSGKEDEGEGKKEGKEGQRKMTRSTSNLRRKPAIRVKRNNLGPPVVQQKRGSKSPHYHSMIREKAQLARAESLVGADKLDTQLEEMERDGPQLADLIEVASQIKSCDSSLNSSTGFMNGHAASESISVGIVSSKESTSTSAAGLPSIVTSQDNDGQGVVLSEGERAQQYVVGDEEIGTSTEVPPLSGDSLPDTADEIEIVDSSDSEEEEEDDEEDEDEISNDELGSSVEQPSHPLVTRQTSQEGQSSEQTQEQPTVDSQPTVSDSHANPQAMEDSGTAGMEFEGSGSWTFMKTPEAGSVGGNSEVVESNGHSSTPDNEEKLSTEPHTPPSVFQFRGGAPEIYATLPRSKARQYGKSSLPTPPQTLIIPRDFSPVRSLKSSSPSSTSSSSISRTVTKKSKGFSRLIEFTRKLSTPEYLHSGMRSVSQSLPPASIVGQLLEEPSEFSSDVFAEPLHYDEEVESLLRQDSVITPPPAKKQALDNEQTQRDEAEGVVVEMKDSLFDSSEAPKHEEEESDQPADEGQVAESRVEGQVEETQVESKEAKNDDKQTSKEMDATERESKEGEYEEEEVPTESIALEVSTDPTEVEEIQTSHLLNEENEEKASQPEPEGADSDSGDIIEEPAQDSTEVEMDETERESKEREDKEEEEELPTESSVLHVSEEEEVQISRLLNEEYEEKILEPEPKEADSDSGDRHESKEGEAKQLSNEMKTSKGLRDFPEEPGVEEPAQDSIEVEMDETERESKEREDKEEEEELPTESSVLHVSEEEEVQISRLLNKENVSQPEPEEADNESGDRHESKEEEAKQLSNEMETSKGLILLDSPEEPGVEELARDSIEVEMEEAEREQEDKEEEELPTESSVLHVSEEEEVQSSRLLNEENEETVSQPEPEEADSDSGDRHESMEEVEARRLSEIVTPKGSILSHSTEEEKPAQYSTEVEANLSAAEEEGTESLETATKAAKVETTTPRVEEETVSIDTETEATKAEAQGEIRDEKEDEAPVETENEDSQTVEFKTDVQSEVTSLPNLPLTLDTSEENVTAQNSIGTNEDVGTHEMHEKEDDGETEPEKSESERSTEDESGKEERVEERDEEYDRQPVLTTEHQLTQRNVHTPKEHESLQATSDVTEPSVAMVAQTNVGLFGVMQSRLRRWGIGRRSMLVFGALTVASFVFLGVNFFYDTANVNDAQAKTSHQL